MKSKTFLIFSIYAFLCTSAFAQVDLQRFIEQMDGTSSHINGPNCWNGALVAAGVVNGHRFFSPSEWLNELANNCREVSTPQKGDVGRLFHPIDGEIHGFIYLNPNMVYQKLGQDNNHGYQIVTRERMLTNYGKRRQCRMNGDDSPECYNELKYYRCDKKSEFEERSIILELNTLMEDLLFDMKTKYVHKEDCYSGSFVEREELLKQIHNSLNVLRIEDFYGDLGHLKHYLESFKSQAYEISVSNRRYKCESRNYKKKTYDLVKDRLKKLLFEIEEEISSPSN